MNIQDLRIGSIVLANGELGTVQWLLESEAYIKCGESSPKWFKPNQIEGVIYSRDWMRWEKEVMPEGWERKCNILPPEDLWSDVWMVDGEGFCIDFQYVHQLQNIVNALQL
jgi:hypothetical protein